MPMIVEDFESIARRVKEIGEQENPQPLPEARPEIQDDVLEELMGYSFDDLFGGCI